jgi:hypothetical protein
LRRGGDPGVLEAMRLRCWIVCTALAVAIGCAPCSAYHYSTCPTDRCSRRCTPSACGGDVCTGDCDGEGSCFDPNATEQSDVPSG